MCLCVQPAEESMTSSEFERFLAERAAAAETSEHTEGTARSQPRHKKEDDTSLFAL